MNSNQFARWLKTHGIVILPRKGTGHKDLYNPENGRWSQMPTHGSEKQLGKGLIAKIKKDLGLS